MAYSKKLINALIDNDSAHNQIEAMEIINDMVLDYKKGVDPDEILNFYGLEQEYWVNLILCL